MGALAGRETGCCGAPRGRLNASLPSDSWLSQSFHHACNQEKLTPASQKRIFLSFT